MADPLPVRKIYTSLLVFIVIFLFVIGYPLLLEAHAQNGHLPKVEFLIKKVNTNHSTAPRAFFLGALAVLPLKLGCCLLYYKLKKLPTNREAPSFSLQNWLSPVWHGSAYL